LLWVFQCTSKCEQSFYSFILFGSVWIIIIFFY
jgi:hypothetical protein